MKSLSAQISILILSLLIILLTIFEYFSYRFGKAELNYSFNFNLQTNVEAIASLTEVEEIGLYEVEFADQMKKRFSEMKQPDVFLVLHDEKKEPIDGSIYLENTPDWILNAESGMVRDFVYKDTPYRGMVLLSTASLSNEYVSETIPVRVFYGTSKLHLIDALSNLRERVIQILLTTAILAALLAGWSARRAMRPLRAFARHVNRVTPDEFGEDFDVETLPTELQKPAAEFNRLTFRLKEAFQREKRFSADAAHELRTPIGAMMVEIQAALRSSRDPEKDTEMLKNIEAETERLHGLCEALLILHTQNSTSDDLMSYDEFTDSIHDAVAFLKPAIKDAECRVELHIQENADQEIMLKCHYSAAHRILSNLLSNALKYAKDGKQIEINVRIENNIPRVECIDHGPGIKPELRDRIFDRFVRGDASRATLTGGSGLGLSISRELARGLGGDLILEDSSEGSKFVWTLSAI